MDELVKCAACAEEIKAEAVICKHCGTSQSKRTTDSAGGIKLERKRPPFYKTWQFWLVSFLVVVAALNGQNLFEFLANKATGVVVFNSARVESEIESGILGQLGVSVDVTCPKRLEGKVGEVRQCTVEDELGVVSFVDVTIQSSSGDLTWQVRN